MSEVLADVLRSQAKDIEDMHTSGLASADSPVSWFHLWSILVNLAHMLDGAGKKSDNRWHFHKFIPRENDERESE